MLITPLLPILVVAVILEALPNEYSPVLSTDRPLIIPTLFPSVSINVNPFSMESSILHSILFNLFLFSFIAIFTSSFSTNSELFISAYVFPSTITSIILLNSVDNRSISPDNLVLKFITS